MVDLGTASARADPSFVFGSKVDLEGQLRTVRLYRRPTTPSRRMANLPD